MPAESASRCHRQPGARHRRRGRAVGVGRGHADRGRTLGHCGQRDAGLSVQQPPGYPPVRSENAIDAHDAMLELTLKVHATHPELEVANQALSRKLKTIPNA